MIVASALVAGCAATPEASRMDDAAAKQFESAPGAAIVYLYRADLASGTGSSTLWLDGRLIGELLPKTYFRVSVRPGRNLLTAYAADTGRLEFATQRGEVYYVAVVVNGVDEAYTSRFSLVPAETAQPQILRCCSLLESWKPGQTRWPL